MIHPKLSLRRPLAVAGAALIGLAAATAIAAPASAHHPIVTGKAVCTSPAGDWKVVWTVANSERDITGTVTKVVTTPAGASITGITVGAELPRNGQGQLTGEQTFTKDQAETKLTITAEWTRPKGRDQVDVITQKADSGRIFKPSTKNCPKSTPTPSTPGTPTPTVPVNPTPSVSPSTSTSPSPSVSPSTSTSPSPSTTPPPAPVTPESSVSHTCDDLTYTVVNPADGKTVTVTVTPNKGEPKTVTVEPGKSGSVSFPAEEGLTVTASGEGVADTTPVAWEKPAGCDSGAGGGDLPLTGAAAGGIAAAALVLLAIGVTLFLVARRRRLTFTA